MTDTGATPRTRSGKELLREFGVGGICGERGEPAYARRMILAIEAESKLDIVLLAASLDNVDREYERGWPPAHYARAIAAEYAALAASVGGGTR